VTAGMAELPY